MEPLNESILLKDLKLQHKNCIQEIYTMEGIIYDKFLRNKCPELMNIIKRDEDRAFIEFCSCNDLKESIPAILLLTFLHQSLKISKFLYKANFRMAFDNPITYRYLIYNQNMNYIKWYYELAKKDIGSVLSDPNFITISGMVPDQKINQFLIEKEVIKETNYSSLFVSYGQSGNLEASKWLLDKTEEKDDVLKKIGRPRRFYF